MTHSTLYLDHSRTPPEIDALDIKRRVEPTLFGEPAVVAVIGSSHYVGVPAIDYHELCSCRRLDRSRVETLALGRSLNRRVRFEHDRLAVETRVAGRPLSAFPGPEGTTVAHRFGPDAYTTVTVDERAIETYHTYPEFDLALYTETAFERVPAARSAAPSRRVRVHNDD
jgi:hypothetical protein